MHNNPQMYNPMAYPMEGMMPNNQGYVMNYQDPNQMQQGYMDPRDQMPRDYNQGYPMKKSYPRNPNFGSYPQKSYRGGMKPMRGRDSRGEGGYPKYNDRKFRPSPGYYTEELGAEEGYGQSKLLPQSKKISKPYPREEGRRFNDQRFPRYEDQHYMRQDYGHPSGMHRKPQFEGPDHKGLNPTMFFKTKMCPHQEEGQCTRGPGCNYAHSQSELREAPNLKKTRLCQLYMSGKCTRGQMCSFAHGEEELRATPEFFKTSLCTGYLRGACRAGEHCRYAHGDEELRLTNPGEEAPKYHPQQQQTSEMSMYRPQYNMSDYELSAYQSMDPSIMEMQQHDYRGPMGNPMPYHYAGQIDPRTQQYENNMNPNETGSDQETEALGHGKKEGAPETASLSNKFDDYMYNNNERPVPTGEAVPKQQAENPETVPFNTNNPEKLNSLSTTQNPNPNGNF